MRTYSLIMYIIFSLILEVVLNKLNQEKEDNFIDYVVISNIYILILSGIFKYHSSNIFLVVLFQTIGEVLYKTYIQERTFTNDNTYDIVKYSLNIITSYLLNILFINKVNTVFLNIEQTKLIIWFLIIGYIYIKLKNNPKIKKQKNKKKLFYQNEEYIVMQYAKLKNKYYKEIRIKNKDLIPLIYSIMIYENYYKPQLIRKIDKYKYLLFAKEIKFGIMQIKSNKYIDDITSIKLSTKKLETIYNKNNDINKTINNYCKDNKKEITSIYRKIIEFDKK